MISDFIDDLCHVQETVSSRLAENPEEAPGFVAKQLFGKARSLPKSDTEIQPKYDLQRALDCGDWSDSRPSQLFLKVSNDELSRAQLTPSRCTTV